MPLLLILILLATGAAAETKPAGALEVTIRGTAQPLEVELFLRDEAENWKEVRHETLPAATRRVRFGGLEAGVYQILLRGPKETMQLATKAVVGRTDARRIAIDVAPFVLAGRITLGGTELGLGAMGLRHKEFHWRAVIELAPDGTFRVPMWQRGAFQASVRAPALPTAYMESVTLDGAPLAIDLPDGRIRGIVRDAAGAPVSDALVLLQTATGGGETHVQVTTDAAGKFDFVGIKRGQQTVRVLSPRHLEPEPVRFALAGLRELDIRLDAGRGVAVVVIDRNEDPVASAKIFAVADGRVCARATTDEDGTATVPVPAGSAATLFVVAEEGPFGMLRVSRDATGGRQRIYLPRTSSSLLIRAQTITGQTMPPFSLLMRFNGELVPPEVAEELAEVQGVRLATSAKSEALLRNIPSGAYEFWPYRTEEEVESIVASGAVFPPIQVDVRSGENKIAVKFTAR